jgi:hypothetical protein
VHSQRKGRGRPSTLVVIAAVCFGCVAKGAGQWATGAGGTNDDLAVLLGRSPRARGCIVSGRFKRPGMKKLPAVADKGFQIADPCGFAVSRGFRRCPRYHALM